MVNFPSLYSINVLGPNQTVKELLKTTMSLQMKPPQSNRKKSQTGIKETEEQSSLALEVFEIILIKCVSDLSKGIRAK